MAFEIRTQKLKPKTNSISLNTQLNNSADVVGKYKNSKSVKK